MDPGSRRSSGAGVASRGQSSVMGVVLVVGITVMGVTGIMLFGTVALQSAHTQSEVEAAENAMTQLDSQFSLVALGSAERQDASVALGSGTSLTVDGDRGWMNVSVYNRTSEEVELVVLNTTLGAVTYENDGTTVAYQGGGVWKRTGSGGSVMVSPPEFHYRTRGGQDPTLTLPLVVVRGGGSLSEVASVSKDATVPAFPNESRSDFANPLQSGQINITVQSEYYRAWGAFFATRTGGRVSYDHDREEVTIVLRVEGDADTISGGIVSGAAASELDFKAHAVADSYNSTEKPYDENDPQQNTSIVTAGSVLLNNNAQIKGDLVAGGDSVELKNNAEITGNVSYGGTLDADKGTIGGDATQDADVSIPGSADWLIDEKVEELEDDSNNNNAAANDVDETNDRLVTDCDPCALPDGNYYFDELYLANGDQLELEVPAGETMEIAVDGDVTLENSAKIEVTGEGTVRFFVEGYLTMKQGSNVSVPGHESPRMWFYMNPGQSATLHNDVDFVGVIYGPGSGAETGVDITLNSNAHVYGGLVGTVEDINNDMYVHFDEALTNVNPIEADDSVPTVTYLHVTTNRVNVSSR